VQGLVTLFVGFLFLSRFTDDAFVTPPSTPPAEEEEFLSVTDSTDALVKELSSEALIDMMYER